MAARADDEMPWPRQLLVALAALLVVALLIGGVVSVVALGAVQVSGIDSPRAAPAAKPSLYLPSGQPTTKLDTYPDPAGAGGSASASASPTASATASPTTSPTTSSPSPAKKPKPISLQAFPQIVTPNQGSTLTGVYPGSHDGAQLQVQQFLNGWVDFPVRVTVRGGLFNTYVIPIRSGVNRLRVIDPAAHQVSNPVRITVG